MFDRKKAKELVTDRRIFIIPALAGAAVASLSAGGYLSWAGIAYYALCAVAVIKKHEKAPAMLWAAVGVHALLSGYALWNFQFNGVDLCPYCLASAGFVLVAATASWRLPAAVLPIILMVSVWYVWPWVFAPKEYSSLYNRTGYDLVQPSVTNENPEEKGTTTTKTTQNIEKTGKSKSG